jgi:peptidase S41-like protein
MRLMLLKFAALLFPLSMASAQTPTPRETAESVASLIEANYFDAERATSIAGEIRAASTSGAWDSISEPLILATALTGIIAPYDGHFRVTWSQPDDGSEAAENGRGRQLYGFGEFIQRSGFGFRRVAVLPGNIGYIDMTNFAHIDFANPEDPARRAVDAALALVAATDAVIIDLRDNGGGSPAMVGYIASAFTAPNAQIYNVFHSRSGEQNEAPAIYYPHPRLAVPLYILTSGRTGSAGEALPYTLQAADRATIIGEATYGGANPGGTFDAGAGFAVFISTGSPVNPITGSNWEGSGVQPDIAIPSEGALDRAQLMALDTLIAQGDAAYRLDREWARSAFVPAEDIAQDMSALVGNYGGLTVTQSGTGLQVRQGRRPALSLVPLGPGLFYRADNPLQRYRFVTDESGAATALETLRSDGTVSRQERG